MDFRSGCISKRYCFGAGILYICLAFFIGAGVFVPAVGRDVYVNAMATGANNGTSWADAHQELRNALPGAAGDVIHLAEGTYTPGTSETQQFAPSAGVNILGGYAVKVLGTAVDPGSLERNPGVHLTILSGDISGDDVLIDLSADPCGLKTENTSGSRIENSNRVMYINTANVILDGLVITGGSGDSDTDDGAGVAVGESGSATLINCDIVRNYTSGDGGGVYNLGTLVLQQCRITDNSSDVSGGGISNEDTLTLEGCMIARNVSIQGYGGGVWNRDNSGAVSCIADDCVITQNKAIASYSNTGGFGGICAYATSTYTLTNCDISSNQTVNQGAGVMIWKYSSGFTGSATMTCTNCLIRGNQGLQYGGGGGYIQYGVTMNLTNCTVVGNQQDIAPGLHGAGAGSVYNLKNCIVWGNNGLSDDSQIKDNATTSFNVNYCCVDDSDPCNIDLSTAGTGNINSDPCFIDLDYYLSADSLCLDAGDPADSVGYEPKCNGNRINMGAYGGTTEATPTSDGLGTLAGDLNCDEQVDLADFFVMASQWLN